MKKFLLSALCAVATLAGSAAEFTYSVDLNRGDLKGTSATLRGVEWTYGTLGNWDGNNNKGYQIGTAKAPVASWSLSTSAFANATITKVTVTAATAKDAAATLEVNVGGASLGSADKGFEMTLATATVTGSANGNLEIKLVNSTEEGKAKAMYIKGWTVTYTADSEIGGGTAPVDPVDPVDPAETVGKGTAESPYTVADVIALNNPGTEAWVKGYIVGCYNYVGESGQGTNVFSATELTTSTNIAIAATPTNYGTNYIAVQLPNKGDIRSALNLVDNAGNFGKEVAVKGTLTGYISTQGVRNTSDYTLNGQTPVEPQVPTEGPGSKDQPYTVVEAIALNNDHSLGWVSGYIVGVMNYDETAKKNVFSATELTTNSNIVIAATAADYGTTYMAVQLPTDSKVRSDLNLVDRPGNLGKEVSVCGSFESYCGTNGVKATSDYTIIGGLAPVEIGEVESLTAFVEDQPATNVKITGAVTVFYQSPDKKYTFITDGTSNIEVYGELANEYKNGDVLTGIIGKFGTHKNMPQLEPQADSFGTATAGTAVEPVTTTLDKVKPADYVLLNNVNIVADGTKFNVTDGTTTLQIFNRFNIEGIEAAEGVTILGIGSVYNDNKQVFPIAINPEQTGISKINAGNGAAVIYDLQGRRLSAPVKGINIINGRKVLVK